MNALRKQKLTQKELKINLKYFPGTGNLRWKKKTNHFIEINTIAGCKDKDNYILIGLKGKLYKAHRLIWLYMEGYLPEHDIDHIDRNPSNNKWDNLRHVSRTCNVNNTGIRKDNTSGVKGVYWKKNRKHWQVAICINQKQIHLGTFKGFTKAVHARYKAEIKYNFPNCNSSSTAHLYLKNKGLIK